MKVFIALSALFAVAAARPGVQLYGAPLTGTIVSPLVIPAQEQYHAQDELGQYAYGYSDALSAKQEVKTFDGVTHGSYSYRDAEGKLQTVDYTADALNGFRVAATNLPKAAPVPIYEKAPAPLPVSDTEEVVAARAAHFAAVEEAKTRQLPALSAEQRKEDFIELPRPVEDTAEVAKAKLEHFAALEEARLRNAAAPAIRQTLPTPTLIAPLALRSPLLPNSRFSYAVASPYLYNSRFLATHIIHH